MIQSVTSKFEQLYKELHEANNYQSDENSHNQGAIDELLFTGMNALTQMRLQSKSVLFVVSDAMCSIET